MSEEIKQETLNAEEEKFVIGGTNPDGYWQYGDRFWCEGCKCEVFCDGTTRWASDHWGHHLTYLGR